MIVTRFAPSPTGYLHLGHAFAALTAYDAAERAHGKFLLRIEDIDSTRCKPEFERAIEQDLEWLGLHWEKPPRKQSKHFGDYGSALAKLEKQDLLYPCFCTRRAIAEEIAHAAEAPHGPEGPIYPGTCRDLPKEERKTLLDAGTAYALRLDVGKALKQVSGPLSFVEEGRGPSGETGKQKATPEIFGDIVLARKELRASYHLAVTVDDALQGVTLVTRGNDLFPATHVQRLLQALLGLPTPVYAHHRLILDAQGKKFSKRDNAVTLKSIRQSGSTPEDVRRMTRHVA
jgi:glutamyl-Q tRNA(Asp) synthetase